MENNKNQRLFGMLGFAMRAGKLTIGTELICKQLPQRDIRLVLISGSASDGTKKKLVHKCEFYEIPAIEVDIDTECLGRILGKSYTPAAVGVCDEGFAREIKKATVSEQTL